MFSANITKVFCLPKMLRTRRRPQLGHMGYPADAWIVMPVSWLEVKITMHMCIFSTILTISSPPSRRTAHGTPADRAAPIGITSQPAASDIDIQVERLDQIGSRFE